MVAFLDAKGLHRTPGRTPYLPPASPSWKRHPRRSNQEPPRAPPRTSQGYYTTVLGRSCEFAASVVASDFGFQGVRDALQYFLGAGILGVLLTQIATWLREMLGRRRERDGLLRILHAELHSNLRSLGLALLFLQDKKHTETARVAAPVVVRAMKTKAWEDTRLTLAQRIPGKEFATITSFYQLLQTAKELLNREQVDDETLRTTRLALKRMDERGQESDQIIRRYVSDAAVEELSEEDLQRLGFYE